MAIAFAHDGRLWIVLDAENVERIQQHDPFEFSGAKVPGVLALRVPLQIAIAYATVSEMPRIQALMSNPSGLVKYLARGFTVTATDHDRPYDAYDTLGELKKD